MHDAVQYGFIEKKNKKNANYHASMGQSKPNSNNKKKKFQWNQSIKLRQEPKLNGHMHVN